MYAIIKSGARQYKVEPGTVLTVNQVAGEPGDKLTFEPLMVSDGSSAKLAADAPKVQAEIVGHEKGRKVIAFKYRPKKGSKTMKGHRQSLTRLRVTAIGDVTETIVEAPAKKVAAKKPAAAKAEPKAKAATATKTATAKPAAKTTAAKAPAKASAKTAEAAAEAKPRKAAPKTAKPKVEKTPAEPKAEKPESAGE